MKQRTFMAVAILALGVTHANAEGPKIRGELALGYDSNIANARQNGDEREVGIAMLNLGVDQTWGLGSRHALQGRFDVQSQAHSDFDGLDNLKGALLARYLYRPGTAFYTPTFALSGSAAWWEFNSGLRDSAEYRASAFVLEQLTTRISARLTTTGNWRRARNQEVFNLRTFSVGADLDWALTNRLALYGGYQRRWGQFVTTRPTPAPPAFVSAPDDAFPGEFAGRQEGAANIGTLGFNIALMPTLALDVQGFYIEAGANTGVHYRRTQAIASVLARF